jgi:hypothetical protein
MRFDGAGLASRTPAVFGSIANYAFLPECLSLHTYRTSRNRGGRSPARLSPKLHAEELTLPREARIA